MEDIDIWQPQQARATGEISLRFTGSVDKDELREGLKAAGMFRRLRWLAAAGALFIAFLGVRVDEEGGSVNVGLVAAAVVYAAVFALLAPRQIVTHALRAQRAHEGADCVVDGTGIAAVLDGVDIKRLGWDAMTRYHETPDLYVVVGGSGRRTWVMVLPKRLMTAPDTELLGAVLDSRLRRG
ncbi:YcxB family protein [Streptomyces yangpuensis]|uniref:YcxB family protein n=1 Tax=Streptomyces yangpuensis TaxID=1648182 RepID=UPI0037154135